MAQTIATLTTAEDSDELDRARVRKILAEMRALDLLAIVECAVEGVPHWRYAARNLLDDINSGTIP